ncbi:nucleotidyltransferase domain-containing protein [Patescibacteria group bacterium]|nr:nucleotidyltransferase domain-containing protein [Patescibacteria group bacterium]MBU4481608.1 nucleotidyltransferase domain-containing protein [Patescibacteria group bacterium]
MRLEFYPVERLKKEILEIVGKYLNLKVYKVFFFGSRVKGDNFPRSDIDVGILGPKPVPSFIKLEIEEELENLPTLYKFDLVDLKKISEKFKKIALKNIEHVN